MITVFDFNDISVSLGYDRRDKSLIVKVFYKEKLVNKRFINLPWLLRELEVLPNERFEKIYRRINRPKIISWRKRNDSQIQ